MGQRKLPPWFGEPLLPSFGLRGYQRGNYSVGCYSRSSKVRVLRRKQTYTGWDKNLKQNQWHTKWPIAYTVWDTNIILMKIWHMFTELFIQSTFTCTVQLQILYKISSTCICNSQDVYPLYVLRTRHEYCTEWHRTGFGKDCTFIQIKVLTQLKKRFEQGNTKNVHQ